MSLKQKLTAKLRHSLKFAGGNGGRRKVNLPLLTAREGYNRWAPDYGDIPTPVQEIESASLEKNLPDLTGKDVLDLGCGRGRVSQLALKKGARFAAGLDLSDRMLRYSGAAAPKIMGTAVSLPFRPESFDLVVCALTMGHVPDLKTTLREIHRVLRPGGDLLITDFHPFATLRGWDRSFVEKQTGRGYAIEQFCHLFSDYFNGFSELGMTIMEFTELLYQQDFPLVFLIKVRKNIRLEPPV